MKISVEIKGVQRMDGETANSFVTAEGTLERSPRGLRLTYTERGTAGERDAVTTVTVLPRQVIIRREGDTVSRLTMEQGHRHESRYDTPYGSFQLGVTTRRCDWAFEKNHGRLLLAYSLDMNGGPATEHEIEITFKEVS